MAKTLTDLVVRQAKARDKQYKIAAGKGLYLLVLPTGGKYWRYKYLMHGKERVAALGVFPEVSCAEARTRHEAARQQRKAGLDPTRERHKAKLRQRAAAAHNFEHVAREWARKQAPRWTKDHATAVLRSLEADVFPDLGKLPVAEVTAGDVLAVLRKIEDRGALSVAGRVRQITGAVMRYAVQCGLVQGNPVVNLAGALAVRPTTNRRALARAELPEFLARLDAYDGHILTRCALRLLLLTFVRTGELRHAKWDEFDLERAEWRIPAERMKMREPHVVPLSTQALAVLERVRAISGDGPLVFPQQHQPKPMSENTVLFGLYRMGYHSRATGHGFRATASTILNEEGWDADVIERQLAHKEANKVRAAYHRAEYLPERRTMMQAWADLLDAMRQQGAPKAPK